MDGRFLLRIEDIDLGRRRPEYEQAIYDDLRWLGLDWEKPVRRQSEHFDDYRAASAMLQARDLLYPCFCTRGDIARALADRPDWPRDPDGALVYPGTCQSVSIAEAERRMAAGEPFGLRLDMTRARGLLKRPLEWIEFGEGDVLALIAAAPHAWGDVLLVRKDIPTSYHLSVVVDDALQGVTDIIRGRDLYPATSVHRVLQALLDLPPPRYRHHHLVLDVRGQKLSKSEGAESLRELRARGVSPQLVRRMAGH